MNSSIRDYQERLLADIRARVEATRGTQVTLSYTEVWDLLQFIAELRDKVTELEGDNGKEAS